MRKHTANFTKRFKNSPNAYIYKFLAQHVFLILIFQSITQNYILAELARMFMLGAVLCLINVFVCVFVFFRVIMDLY